MRLLHPIIEAAMNEKNLLILRHGEAANHLRDIKRPLTGRGRSDVVEIGNWLRQQGLQPDLVIASSAERTTETAHLCCEAAGVDTGSIRRERALYHADCDGWLAELASVPEGVNTVLLIGHNPTLSWLASQLADRSIMLEPANLVHLIISDAHWNGAMKLQQVMCPQQG
ncbi:MAG: histidine phosphatase family protein [Mariprofundales bacterium]